MAVRYEFEGNLMRLVCEGEYPASEVIDTFSRAMADPGCPAAVSFLMDVRGSTSLETRSADDLRRVVAFLRPFVERINRRCAVVVSSDVQYGLGRMSGAFADELGVEGNVFRDEAQAIAWLARRPTVPDGEPPEPPGGIRRRT